MSILKFALRSFPLLALAVTTHWLFGQGTSARITGTLQDSTGAIVPNAAVRASSVDSGQTWNTISNEAGIYTLPSLPPGGYTLSVEANGFKRLVTNAITLEINQVARVDLKLEVGAVAETLSVSGLAPLLQTESTQLGSIVTGNTTVNLPLNGRNFSQLTLLAPGVVTFDTTSYTDGSRSSSGGRPMVNGNRAQANNFRLDGFDNNESQDNLIAYYPSVDAIHEFKLITSNPPAEFGNSMGAIVNTTLKSGINTFHGSAFDFLRNDAMDSNTWFGNATRQPRPHFAQNIFGGTFGGPVKKNKLFFFSDYQGWRRGKGLTSSVRTLVPTAWRTGDFSSQPKALYNPLSQTEVVGPTGAITVVRQPFPGNQIPQSLISPVARNLFSDPSIYPNPLIAQNANNWNGAGRQTVVDDQGDIKLDYRATQNDSLSGRYSMGHRDATTIDALRVVPQAPDLASTISSGINYTRIISPTMINEARVGFNRYHITQIVADTGNIGNYADKIGIPGINTVGPGLPLITFADASSIGNSGSQSRVSNNTYQYGDDFTITKGRHIIKTGFELLRYQQNRYVGSRGVYGTFDFNGSYTQQIGVANTGSGVADFLLGYPDNLGRAGGSPWGHRQIRWGAFVQDDFKVRNNVTLNLGLRYEYITPLVEVKDRQSNFDLTTGKQLFAGVDGNSRGLYEPYKKGFQPRLGLAWTPARFNNAVVVRMAYGILNYLESTGTNRRLPVNPPYFVDFFAQYDARFLGTKISDGFPTVSPTGPPSGSLRVFPAVLKPAIVQQWNVTLEFKLPGNIALSTAYVGQDATHLMMANRYYSQAVLGTGTVQERRRSFGILPLATEIVVTDPRTRQNYQGFQMNLQKRLSSGLEFTTSYTWSHSMSDNAGYYGTSVASTASPQNYGNLNAEWGPASMDVRHNLTASMNYMLPFGKGKQFGSNASGLVNAIIGGWMASSVLTLRTGLPLTIIETPDTSNTGSSGPRPNRIADGNLPRGERTPNRWFDTSAFVRQTPNTFGNAGQGVIRMPGIRNLDFSLIKQIPIGERRLEFRAESFNVTNTPLFSGVGNSLGQSTFGTITAAQAERKSSSD
jgi:hypothetical protein